MKRYLFTVGTNRVGSKVQRIVELEDNLTDKELEEYYVQWVWENIDSNYYEIDENNEIKEGK